jgi:hypothetical protein
MNLQERISLADRLGKYMLSDDPAWQQARTRAGIENSWFIPEFVNRASAVIATSFLRKDILERWAADYQLPAIQSHPKTIGVVMAGNLPLVGFHDWLCIFIAGHKALVKPSARDTVLIRHLLDTMTGWDTRIADHIAFADRLKGCDGYIATGSNNTAGYFEYYFGKYPHIIRRNKTSVAVLTGNESPEELDHLADDVFLYFGLGCRNVTKLYVPHEYDFIPLLSAFRKYNWMADHNKYKNNYDYNLALHILNKKFYMSTEALLLVEEDSLFSRISQLNYEFYRDHSTLAGTLPQRPELQCIVGHKFTPFGQAQNPEIGDYADGVDTLAFLQKLH